MEELTQFLKSREISDKTISKMLEENIDSETILKLSDEQLKSFIPKLGDRIALKEFCKENCFKTSRKTVLLDKLRNKLENKRGIKYDSPGTPKKRTAFEKATRAIEIGWMCSLDGNRLAQVRTRCGGGTRKIDINKFARCEDILSLGIALFFPNDKSSKGLKEEFSFKLLDFQERDIPEKKTVEDLYAETGFSRLRFYVASIQKTTTNTNEEQKADEIVYEGVSKINTDIDNNSKLSEGLYEDLVANATANTCEFMDPLHTALQWFDNSFIEIGPDGQAQYSSSSVDSEAIIKSDTPVKIIIHRGQVLKELIESFLSLNKDCGPIEIEMVLSNGQPELALDQGGVYRDCLSEFWESFYDLCTTGTKAKVPFLRHDYDSCRWQAVAKILYRGWKDVKYFPISLSKPFMEQCILGKIETDLTESFLLTLSDGEKSILETAMNKYEEIDYNELLDVLNNLECKSMINEKNIIRIINDISHKEIIQKPNFVIDAWKEILENILTQSQLNDIYQRSNPSAPNIIGRLLFDNNVTLHSKNTINFLKKFLRESNEEKLKGFLRFATGADIITDNNITVSFNSMTGIKRVPIAHTCGCVLELSTTYENFPEFRTEMNAVLDSKMWIMDML